MPKVGNNRDRDEKPKCPFKVGDVVQINSGGPLSTVIGVNAYARTIDICWYTYITDHGYSTCGSASGLPADCFQIAREVITHRSSEDEDDTQPDCVPA
jgi:uncharacterized protein YodC (DUF2158 family)